MKCPKSLIALASALAGSLATPAFAVIVTIPAEKDAMIFGTAAGADTNNASGKGPALFAGADGSSNRKRSLLQFDIASAVPANATITSVTLTLYLAQVAGSGGGSGGGGNYPSRTFRLYDNLQTWTEGPSGSPTSATVGGTGQGYTRVAGDTSWDYASYDPANPTSGRWNAGAADLHGGNFSPTQSAASTFTVFTTLNAPFTWSSQGMVDDVQHWFDGTASNYGWLLQSDLESSPTSFLGFWSKDGAAANANPSIAPALTIAYVSAVPDPTPLSTLGLAATPLLLPRRRRH